MSDLQGTLYLVPTPIGNLEDMTLRAIRILKEVDKIAAEDTRRTQQLLNHFDIQNKVVRYDEHTREKAGEELIEQLKSGLNIAVVSDAGMPGIADPGTDLVERALQEHIPVIPLPGANAGLTALIASGLPTENFFFAGFLPRTAKKQKESLEKISQVPGTLIFYEALKSADAFAAIPLKTLGDRDAVWGREITKKFETFRRGKLSELLAHCQVEAPRGEYVLLIAEIASDQQVETIQTISPQDRLTELLDQGIAKKEAARQVAQEFSLSRREVYNWTIRPDQDGDLEQ